MTEPNIPPGKKEKNTDKKRKQIQRKGIKNSKSIIATIIIDYNTR